MLMLTFSFNRIYIHRQAYLLNKNVACVYISQLLYMQPCEVNNLHNTLGFHGSLGPTGNPAKYSRYNKAMNTVVICM